MVNQYQDAPLLASAAARNAVEYRIRGRRHLSEGFERDYLVHMADARDYRATLDDLIEGVAAHG